MRKGLVCLVFAVALILAFCPVPSAQGQTSGTGALAGTVQDATPAVVPGATVTVTNSAGASQTATTDAKGEYRVQGLSPGTYKVTVSAPGFKDFEATNAVVAPGQTTRLDVTVELAGVSTSVSVQGQAATEVETQSSQITGEVTNEEITTFGLNGRNFTQLAALSPGVSNQSGQDEALVGVKGSVKYSVNGGRVEYNSYQVDGGDILNASINGSTTSLTVFPSLDAISDMQVLTSNYGAMYGKSASGTITATTKSGDSNFHGDAYFYFRNNHLNARNFFDPANAGAPLYQKYDQGGTIGGPLYIPGHYNVKKDKTFFFFSEEYHHDREPQDFNQAVPSMQERDCTQARVVQLTCATAAQNRTSCAPSASVCAGSDFNHYGDFSDVCPSNGAIFSRGQYPDCPGTPFGNNLFQTYPNNLVAIDPVSQEILNANLIPLPNATSGCNSAGPSSPSATPFKPSCFVAALSPLTTWREELFRIDHNITAREKIYFRYIHDAWRTVSLTPQWDFLQSVNPATEFFPTVQNQFVGPGISMVTHWTSTISNSFVNDVAMSYTTDHISLTDIPGNIPGQDSQHQPFLQRPAALNPASGFPCYPQPSQTSGSITTCGMGSLFAPDSSNPFGGKLPAILIGGTNQAYGGTGFAFDTSYMPWHHSNPTYSPRDDATWVHGSHTVSFGIQVVIAQRNEVNPPVGANSGNVQGTATFTNIGNRNTSGNAFADFLGSQSPGKDANGFVGPGVSAIQSFEQVSGQAVYHNNYKIIEPYVQDDWRMTKRLTVNLGIRFSLFGLYHEKYLQSFNFVPSQFQLNLPDAADGSGICVDSVTGALVTQGTCRQLGSPFHPSAVQITQNGNWSPYLVNGLVQCGANGVPAGCMTNRWFNPAPRVGFAWDPTGSGKTSIRAGYGIFFEHGTGNEANTGSLEGSPGTPGGGILDMTQYYPSDWGCIGLQAANCLGNKPATSAGTVAFPINATSIPTKVIWPYAQQWSFSVQRQLPWKLLGSIAYVGSKGTNLAADVQINQLKPVNPSQNPFAAGQSITPGLCAGFASSFNVYGTQVSLGNPAYVNLLAACTGFANQIPTPDCLRQINQCLPQFQSNISGTFAPPSYFPTFGQVFSLANIASSRYNALQITLRRSARPLTLGVSYSYSHSIDDSSDRTSATFINAYDLAQNRASSDFDQRHLLNINYIYDLPLVKMLTASRIIKVFDNFYPGEKAPDANTLADWHKKYFDGWQLSGITVFATGTPFSVLNGGSACVGTLDNPGVAAGIGPGSYASFYNSATAAGQAADAADYQGCGSGTITPATPRGITIGPALGNAGEFGPPQGLTYGNTGRNFLRNPNQFNFDMTFSKQFKVRESDSLEFRLETYNIFNHTQFRVYDPANPGNAGNNVITCYGVTTWSAAGDPVPGSGSSCSKSSFLHPVDAHRARTMQLALKFLF